MRDGEAMGLGLFGLSAYQAARGQTFGPATENFWNAYGALRILNNPTIALIFAGLGAFQMTRGRWIGSATTLLFYALVIRQMCGLGFGIRWRPPSPANSPPQHGK